MRPARIVVLLLARTLIAGTSILQNAGAASAMTASPFDGSRRIVVISAGSADAAPVREQRAELLKHVAALDERDMAVFVALPDGGIDPIHGPPPTPAEAHDFLRRQRSSEGNAFTVLLVGKDGGVKFRSERPVRAEELFALIDAMPMRRQEMQR